MNVKCFAASCCGAKGFVFPSVIKAYRHRATPPLFTNLLPADYAAITSATRAKTFTRGEMLYLRGDTVHQVLLLISGYVKVTHFSQDGTEVILRLGAPGDVLGAVSLMSTGRYDTTAQVFRSCQALVWEARTFKALSERHPVLQQNMVGILSRYLIEIEERFHEVATERVGPRVARQLLRLRDKIGHPVANGVELCLSREELGQMTGTTLFTVSRLLSSWEICGIVKPSREAVTICDAHALSLIAQEK